jgi:site-specific DNA-methyltransferase (adenine-specific)
MQTLTRPLDSIHPYPENPRINEGAVEGVLNSIKEFGFINPIIIDSSGEIIAGHVRYKAAQRLGMSEVPTIVADHLSPEQAKAYRLADNKTAEVSEWDLAALEQELAELVASFDMSLFGFETGETEAYPVEVFVSEVVEPLVRPGEVWILGRHRVMCGDSTDPSNLLEIVGGGARGPNAD